MGKYETELRLEVVKTILAGVGGAKLLARRWSVPEENVRLEAVTTGCTELRASSPSGVPPLRTSSSRYCRIKMHELRSSRQEAAIFDIRNPNPVVVWRCALDVLISTQK